MIRKIKAFAVLAVLSLGLWGCAQGNGSPQAQADRIKQLETKYARLESQSRNVEEARDQATRELIVLRDEAANMRRALEVQKSVIKERDALRMQIDARTVERDMLQTRCDQLKNGLQTLLKQVETTPTSVSETAKNN